MEQGRVQDSQRVIAQKSPVLLIPEGEEFLALEAKETTEYTVGGQSLSLTRFQYSFSVLADNTEKIYLVEWPARKVAFVRKG